MVTNELVFQCILIPLVHGYIHGHGINKYKYEQECKHEQGIITINRNIHVARVSRETRSIGYQGRVWD